MKRMHIRSCVMILKKRGFCVSAIAKELGISYKYAKTLYEQS